MFKNKEEQFDFYWKEIFAGLAYNPIEFNTYRFDQTMSLPGKVNKLYDMFKVLAMNNQEVMDYLKVFVETFDFKLETTIKDILIVWLNEGLLADVVREAISEEVIEARTDNLGQTYLTLKERLDTEREESIITRDEVIESRKSTEGKVYENLNTRLQDESTGILVEGLTTKTFYDTDTKTKMYITRIPKKTKTGNKILMKQAFCSSNAPKTGREVYQELEVAPVVLNAGMTTSNNYMGLYIKNGKVREDKNFSQENWILAWNDENQWGYYRNSNTENVAAQILADGYTEALTAFTPLVWNGEPHLEGMNSYRQLYPDDVFNPHQIIAIKMDGTFINVCCDGRNIVGSKGWNVQNAVDILMGLGVDKAFMLDGGGSTQTVVQGAQVNHNHDEFGKKERPMLHYLYFEVDTIEKNSLQRADITQGNVIGNVRKAVADIEVDLFRKSRALPISTSESILNMPSGFYEGNRPIAGIPIDGVFLYHVIELPRANIKIIQATGSFGGFQKYTRTLNGTDGATGTKGWLQEYPREENLFNGEANLNKPIMQLSRSIYDFNYIEVEYTYFHNARDVVKLRIMPQSQNFSIRAQTVTSEGVSTNTRVVVNISSDGRTLNIAEDSSLDIDEQGVVYTASKKTVIINKIMGEFDSFQNPIVKGVGE